MVPSPNQALPTTPALSISNIQKLTEEILNVRPCLWQLKVVEALLKRDQDVLCVAGTGMGKTLTFWMPLLFRPDGIQIIVTPLTMLGKQNAASLAKAGIKAIAINSETATPQSFQVTHAPCSGYKQVAHHAHPCRPSAHSITKQSSSVPSR